MLRMKNGGTRGSRVPGKLTPVNDLRLALPISRVRWSLVGDAWRGGPDHHHFVVAAAVAAEAFSRSGLCGFRIVGERRLPPPAVMDFRYRKVLAREIFFLRGAAIRGNRHFR